MKDDLSTILMKLKTPEECEIFARNAIERGRADLAVEARKRAVQLRTDAYGVESEIEKECLKAIYAYEEALHEKNGKKTKATRTWQMIKRHGIVAAVERAICRPTDTLGYETLKNLGLDEFTFEAVALKYPEHFSAESVEIAKSKATFL